MPVSVAGIADTVKGTVKEIPSLFRVHAYIRGRKANLFFRGN